MNPDKEREEKLRESACIGDVEQMKQLVEKHSVNINSQNTINGWTPLHWACKRNHVAAVKYLVANGANPTVENLSKEIPAQLTNTEEIRTVLQYEGGAIKTSASLPIVPNYIKNPVFPYSTETQDPVRHSSPAVQQKQNGVAVPYNSYQSAAPQSYNADDTELVLKARIGFSDERDYIEVELARNNLTFDALLSLLCRELSVEKRNVYKVRKMPNTILRKDKDVKRLRDFQEIELVLTNKAMTARGYGDFSDGYRREQILY